MKNRHLLTSRSDAKHWHDRADELRMLAELQMDETCRAKLLKNAEEYDSMARQREDAKQVRDEDI